MKVLQINVVYAFSSTGRITKEIDLALRQAGEESYVACSYTTEPNPSLYIIGGYFGKKLHAIMTRLSGFQGYFSTFSTKKLIKYIDVVNPDIVHLHNLHSNYINLPILYKYLAQKNIPTVMTLHDCWAFTGGCTHYTVNNCFKWQQECGECPVKHVNYSLFIDPSRKIINDNRRFYSDIKNLGVIGVSNWIANQAKKSILSNAKLIEPIYNWIDLDVFKPTESDLREKFGLKGKCIILGVAQKWVANKGLEDFINLAQLVNENEVIVLIGKIDDCIKLPKNIINVYETNGIAELAEFYSIAEVFVSFSREETFGLVVAESLACGTPVIVVNATASPELVGEKCGKIIEAGDVNAALDYIREMEISGKTIYRSNCIEFARANFSKELQIKKYISFYNELLRESN